MFITDNHVSQTNMGPLGGARSGGVQAVVLRCAHQRHYRGGEGGARASHGPWSPGTSGPDPWDQELTDPGGQGPGRTKTSLTFIYKKTFICFFFREGRPSLPLSNKRAQHVMNINNGVIKHIARRSWDHGSLHTLVPEPLVPWVPGPLGPWAQGPGALGRQGGHWLPGSCIF